MSMKRVLLILKATLFLCFLSLTARADSLAQSPDWLALIHYRPAFFGFKSTIDSDNFFLAPDGKTNPSTELTETIRLFQSDDIKTQCRFPARYQFLKQNNLIQTPFPACPDYEQFKKDLNPIGVTLLYTDAYMNNPASLFGHTLMRIDIPEGRTQLVAHGVNYGAFVNPNENGVLFAVLGLTGGYMGGFTVKPYYDVINTYNNIENRDIWEFHLNLTPDELDFFVAHLWELGHTQTRYFFFTENCSYLLMEFLDAIRPSLQLADRFPVQAIPLDTLKAVHAAGLIDAVQYRPSRQRRIAERYRYLNRTEKKALLNYLDTMHLPASLNKEQQAAVLETAFEFIQYQWSEGKTDLKTYRKQTFQTLQNRTKLDTPSTPPEIQLPSPLTAHHSARLSVAQGFERGNAFQEIQIRPAYHTLTDRPDGLLRGSQINFLNTTLRYDDTRQQLSLHQLQLIDIASFSPWNNLFHPFSYTIQTGMNRNWNPKTNTDGYTYDLSGGTGITAELTRSLYAFIMGETGIHYGGFLPHSFGLNIGAKAGIIGYFDNIQLLIEAERLFSDNWYLNQTNMRAQLTYSIAQNWGLSATYQLQNIHPHSQNTLTLGVAYFF